MALYRCEAKIISRQNRGHSVVAASAYRSGTRIQDERNDRIHDYSRRQKGVIESVILRPQGAPEWTGEPNRSNMTASIATIEPECVILVHQKKQKQYDYDHTKNHR